MRSGDDDPTSDDVARPVLRVTVRTLRLILHGQLNTP